jgi:hypothetical protein
MSARHEAGRQRELVLVDLLDRLMAGGVVLDGDLTLAIADVDLVYVGLRAIISSVASVEERSLSPPASRRTVPA